MFTVTRPSEPLLAGLHRRRFLQIGTLGPLGLGLPGLALGAAATADHAPATSGRAKRCILVFLNGGPSQLDTWDMKPDAPAEVRGELRPIRTNVAGIVVSELLPRMALLADRYKIVRTVTHNAPVHTTAVYTMLTGTYHRTPKVDQTRITPADHPHLGAIYARTRCAPRSTPVADAPGSREQQSPRPSSSVMEQGVPPFVCLPTLFRAAPVDGVWPGQTAGFLGRRFDPLVIEGEKQSARFRLPEVELPASMTAARLAQRRNLLQHLDAALRRRDAAMGTDERDAVFQQAWSLLDSRALRRAVDLTSEPAAVRHCYGEHLFGQGLLLARRLIEAEIPLVTVYWIDPTPAGAGGGEFDSHGRIDWHMRNRLLPPADQALSALVADLWDRGLHDDTLLVVMSEFGRTPTINKDAGRDHWPDAQSILLAGAGITGGTIYGATDRHAAYPTADPVTPPDLGQTILHLLGVGADTELRDREGRPVSASEGKVNVGLLS